jgi:hypothetical protein
MCYCKAQGKSNICAGERFASAALTTAAIVSRLYLRMLISHLRNQLALELIETRPNSQIQHQ